ncbi:MAG: hypothetical protein JO062_19435 [Bryobacterales bacterium]|nr:hypothetical protein [Bryobacterales bacterium]
MFELLFKYPSSVFSKGSFVLLSGWPLYWLGLAVVAAAAVLGWLVWRRSQGTQRMGAVKGVAVWILQTAMIALLLFLLWHPALSIATLKPQQNIVALVLDDSASMAVQDEGGSSRKDKAVSVLNSGLLNDLQSKFQVRLYKMSDHLDRLEHLEQLTAAAPVTHIGDSLKQVVEDAQSLPIGAVVLMSDGADNSGGIDLGTISDIRRQRIPVHTIGFGREKMAHDIEISDVEIAPRALPDSRLAATVHLHQHGYAGQKVRINVKDGSKLLSAQEITLKQDGVEQIEPVLFNVGPAGVKTIETSIDPLSNEENPRNNHLTRLVNVDQRKPRILYFEGEPRWEFKFLRRAVEDDRNLDLMTIVRTTENKTYTQGPNKDELKDGFPTKVEELFVFDGLILGSVDAPYLKPQQQELIRQFVDRRGGGLLFLGGRDSLADGGWGKSPLKDLLPTVLPDVDKEKGRRTFFRIGADVELTNAGRESLITRIEENPDKNVERWKKLPYIMNFQDPGEAKPGATVLAKATPREGGGAKVNLLITQPFGRGRTAIFATGGSWRWQMLQPVSDMSHETFYRQLLRWLVSDTPRRVTGSTPKQLLADEANVKLRAEVRDTTYLPAGDATVEAHITGPEGVTESLDMRPEPLEQGLYVADYTTPKPGSYLVDIVAKHGQEDLGHDTLTFRREDGVAENFHVEQNRELLEKLSSETGGRYYKPNEASRLGKDINYSEAGITIRETRDLWDMPVIFLVIVLLRSIEWLLRRKWGVI